VWARATISYRGSWFMARHRGHLRETALQA
jgi:hypothetical protein